MRRAPCYAWVEMRRALPIGILVASSVTSAASAQPTSAAQALFEEGRRLLKEGSVQIACDKFAESERIEPAGGTLMNLAACHEREGKSATAWAEFKDALEHATRDGREDRVTEAKRRIAELEQHLTRVRLTVQGDAPPGLEVSLDGLVLGTATLSTAIPIDPGEHDVRASAPGFAPWTARVVAPREGAFSVVVPPLAHPAAAPPVVAAPDVSPSAADTPIPVGAYVLLGIGAAGIGTGTYFGVLAAAKKHDSSADCSSAGCTSEGASLLQQANSAAWASDVGLGVGVASLLGAAYFYLTRHSSSAPSHALRMAPVLGSSGVGLRAEGVW
jgi:hypothetical protein